jgi:hypothetical protein
MTARALVTLALAGVVASGCALTDITLQAPQQFEVAPGSGRGQGREIVVVRPFRDARPAARCGMKKNGYNQDSASIFCRAPASMVADLVAAQLSQAGFRVLRDRRDASPSTIILSGSLEQLFVEPKNNYFSVEIETDVALRLWATTTSGFSAERRFYVKGDEATFFASDDDMQLSFDAGVRQLVSGVVGAVANLSERLPAPPALEPLVPPPPPPSPADLTDPDLLDGDRR